MTTLFIGLLVGFWLSRNASSSYADGSVCVSFSFGDAIADVRSAVQAFLDAGLATFLFGQKVRSFVEVKVLPALSSVGVEVSIPVLLSRKDDSSAIA